MFLFMFLFIFLFMTFYQCFFIMFLNKRIGETPIIYYVLPHSISRFSLKTRMGPTLSYWGNPYHLLCASPFYFPADVLRKPLSFTMCFPILFPDGLDFLWKHAWAQPALTGETPIIYYVLPHRVHPIPRRAPWGHPYYLLCASPSDRVLRRAHCHWGNLYYLVGASPVIDVRGLASTLIVVDAKPFLETLGKPLLFSRCFPIIFPGERIGKR